MPWRRAPRRDASATARSSLRPSKRRCASAPANVERKQSEMTPKEAIELAKKHDVKFVDLKFIDFPGVWQHTTIPAWRLDEALFEDGIGFDGSSIRGWQPINASDMLIIPDADTARIDPFHAYSTLHLVCSVFDPITKQPYSRDPRHIAKKAEAYLRQTGLGDTCFMGPEAEFFVFDDVRFDHSQPNAGY